jgi:hypothetical protein
VSDWKNPLRFPGQWFDIETGLHKILSDIMIPLLVFILHLIHIRDHLEAPYGLILTGGNIYGYAEGIQ